MEFPAIWIPIPPATTLLPQRLKHDVHAGVELIDIDGSGGTEGLNLPEIIRQCRSMRQACVHKHSEQDQALEIT